MRIRTLSAAIPDRILYACRPEQIVGNRWDDFEGREYASTRVVPTFPTDADSEQSCTTAREWANHRRYGGGPAGSPPVENPACEYVVENKPIGHVRVCTLEIRNEGGRAYKVAIPRYNVEPGTEGTPLYVDMREDVMLEAMLTKGVAAGGLVEGPFVWARIGSQMKLIRMGSALHDVVVEADARRRTPPTKASDLALGGVYADAKGNHFIYLGLADAEEIVDTLDSKSGQRHRGTLDDHDATRYVRKEHRGVQVWIEIPSWQREQHTPQQIVERMLGAVAMSPEDVGLSAYYLHLVKKKSVRRQVGDVVELPQHVMQEVRAMVRRSMEADLAKRRSEAGSYRHMGYGVDHSWASLAYYSAKATVRLPGSSFLPPKGFDDIFAAVK